MNYLTMIIAKNEVSEGSSVIKRTSQIVNSKNFSIEPLSMELFHNYTIFNELYSTDSSNSEFCKKGVGIIMKKPEMHFKLEDSELDSDSNSYEHPSDLPSYGSVSGLNQSTTSSDLHPEDFSIHDACRPTKEWEIPLYDGDDQSQFDYEEICHDEISFEQREIKMEEFSESLPENNIHTPFSMIDKNKIKNDILNGLKVAYVKLQIDTFYLRNFVCSICYNVFRERYFLYKHRRDVHKVGAPISKKIHNVDRRLQCKTCAIVCTELNELLRHNSAHLNEHRFQCDLCSYQSERLPNLKIHMYFHKKETFQKCRFCAFKSLKVTGINTHLKTHNLVKHFRCRVCRYEIEDLDDITRHISIHDNIEIQSCNKCMYKTLSISDFKFHTMIHRGFKPFNYVLSYSSEASEIDNVRNESHKILKCELCTFVSISLSELAAHKLNHFYVTLYRQDITSVSENSEIKCSETYENNSKADSLNYTEITLLKCKKCTFVCYHFKEMKVHESLHRRICLLSKVKKSEFYKCHLCSSMSKSKCDIKNHKLYHALLRGSKYDMSIIENRKSDKSNDLKLQKAEYETIKINKDIEQFRTEYLDAL